MRTIVLSFIIFSYSPSNISYCNFSSIIDILCCLDYLYNNKVMSLGDFNISPFNYNLGSAVLTRNNSVHDLGVTYNSKFAFDVHINKLTNDCFKTLDFIIRNSRDLQDLNVIKLLFIAYVRSRFDYACIVWSPHFDRYLDAPERIQRRFLKYLYYRK